MAKRQTGRLCAAIARLSGIFNTVNKDGYHFVTSPLRWIMKMAMGKFGKYVSLPKVAETGGRMTDIPHGQRYVNMQLSESDLAVLVHADGAAISKSSKKKMYLIFVQPLDLPLRIRRPLWFLQSAWTGEHLLND